MTGAWRHLDMKPVLENLGGLLGAFPWVRVDSVEHYWVVGKGDEAVQFSNLVQRFITGVRVSKAAMAANKGSPGSAMRDIIAIRQVEHCADISHALLHSTISQEPRTMSGMEQLGRKWPSWLGKAEFLVGFLREPRLTVDPDSPSDDMLLISECTLLMTLKEQRRETTTAKPMP